MEVVEVMVGVPVVVKMSQWNRIYICILLILSIVSYVSQLITVNENHTKLSSSSYL